MKKSKALLNAEWKLGVMQGNVDEMRAEINGVRAEMAHRAEVLQETCIVFRSVCDVLRYFDKSKFECELIGQHLEKLETLQRNLANLGKGTAAYTATLEKCGEGKTTNWTVSLSKTT